MQAVHTAVADCTLADCMEVQMLLGLAAGRQPLGTPGTLEPDTVEGIEAAGVLRQGRNQPGALGVDTPAGAWGEDAWQRRWRKPQR